MDLGKVKSCLIEEHSATLMACDFLDYIRLLLLLFSHRWVSYLRFRLDYSMAPSDLELGASRNEHFL